MTKHKTTAKALPGILLGLISLNSCASTTNQALEKLKRETVENLVFVEGGAFIMGDVGYTDEEGQFHDFTNDADVFPVHQVTLTSYSIMAYEVTFNDFDFYTKHIGKELAGKKFLKVLHRQGLYPATFMTWHQARDYCQWLGQQIGYPMDLPTEAQWEYAARSRGLAVAHATDNGDIEYGVNYRDPRKVWHPMPVGSWPPQPPGHLRHDGECG